MKKIFSILITGFCMALLLTSLAHANNKSCYKYDWTHDVTKAYSSGMTDADNAEIFIRGLPAAACIGYYAYANKKQLNDEVMFGLKTVISLTAEMVEADCKRDNVTSFGSSEKDFAYGEKLVLSNTALVANGNMSMNELRARISACAMVTKHYFDIFNKLSK